MHKSRTPENIEQAKLLHSQGLSRRAIGEVFGVGETCIRQWLDPDSYARHKARVGQWQKDNRILVNKRQSKRVRNRTKAERDIDNAKQRVRYATDPKVRETFNRLAKEYRRDAQYYIGMKLRTANLSHAQRLHRVNVQFMEAVTGMTSDEYTAKYCEEGHFDHIVPLCSFDLTNPEHLVRAVHPSNIRILPPKENMSKGDAGRLDDVMHLPWVNTDSALKHAQMFITKYLTRLARNNARQPEVVG